MNFNDDEIRIIRNALEFYLRIGIGQFDRIKDHPTFSRHLIKEFALGSGEFKVGDETVRGEVVEVGPGWIKTKGSWGKDEEIKKWEDLDNIYYSPDWEKYHETRKNADNLFS